MIDEKEFESIIEKVISNDDRVIVLYSGIWSFINKLKFKTKNVNNIPKIILNILEKKIKKKKLFLSQRLQVKFFPKKKLFI